ncbi:MULTISPECIES: arsenate reductase (glutaredoxin) [Altibacter]|uniref:arsenate reductase (glutaredoxin) n=1 Tax=Altibacter TaxID=1535231 RepID=UPI0005544E2D|nr:MULTISPECIES: arsenate reductase (glutaredoxin) [Altibacter]MCW8981900.1 arsenate reductase (glutaredoxin) [Altibacter sp.]MCW9037991.1 arsenate reductase (glutaredoxin) [Altibacter sp.]
MITLYHNPRCSKSRECNTHLTSLTEEVQVINYMETPFTKTQLKELLKKLGISPIELVRTNEAIWKSDYKGKELTDAQIITAMVTHPRLIQRPIVVKGAKAVIGRPLEAVDSIL